MKVAELKPLNVCLYNLKDCQRSIKSGNVFQIQALKLQVQMLGM